MSTALRLAERGQDVVLVEAEFCGFGASSRNAGQLAGAPGGDVQLLNLLFRKRFGAVVQLAEHAAHFVEQTLEDLQIDCDYEPVGNVHAAVSKGQMGRTRRVAKVLEAHGAKVRLGTSAELGIPRTFVGGLLEEVGGTMNPGRFTRGMRAALLASGVRVFERTRAVDVARDRGGVTVRTPGGEVRADQLVVATNAFAGDLSVTPSRLSVPIWVVEVETEPIDPERLAGLGWTRRSGMVTQHNVMENYRLTPDSTVVFGVRRLERGTSFPLPAKRPDPGMVAELGRAFRTRFPSLADVRPARAWGGWIAITSSWLPVVCRSSPEVVHLVGCNGHGLAQAPYLGRLLADALVEGTRHPDLEAAWVDPAGLGRPVMMGAKGLRTIWAVDRCSDLVNGSRRRARRASAGAA
jgi:glycine/D-amino acid oxidase-like deaminating enzyme